MLVVTKVLEAGVPVKDVSIHGRWLTEGMPLRCKHNSDAYKVSVASKIPYLTEKLYRLGSTGMLKDK